MDSVQSNVYCAQIYALGVEPKVLAIELKFLSEIIRALFYYENWCHLKKKYPKFPASIQCGGAQ